MSVVMKRPAALATSLLIGTAAAGLIAGCGSSASGSAGGTTTSGPVPLVVYSAQGYDSPMVKAFQAATGIPTKLTDDSTGPLLAKIQSERANPQWGLLWVDGDEAFASLDQQGALVKGFAPNVTSNPQGQAVEPADKSYVPTGLTVTGAMVYDASKVANPPTSFQDLLSPAWKGAVGMNNPAVSGPTYPFVAGMFSQLGSDAKGKAFYSGLKANGLHIFNTNGDTMHALQTGQIKIALVQSTVGIAAGLKDKNIKTAYLPKVTSLPSIIGIDAKVSAKEQQEAEQFASFVLSPAGQKVMLGADPSGDSLYWPVVTGVTPNPALPDLSTVPTQAIDPKVWGPKEGTINSWFTNTIVQ
jgi:iron(III) transport system substrate-binding protein